MDFKDSTNGKFRFAVNHFTDLSYPYFESLAKQLGTHYLRVIIVPSSKKGGFSTGLQMIVNGITKPQLVHEVNYLVRMFDVPKAHKGGDRSMDKHIKSIKVNCIPHKNTPVLLLDDVTTSGNTMIACETILKKAGVTEIYKLAIGKSA